MQLYRKIRLQKRERKGLIFIHEMMLWRNHDMFSGMAATDSHQVLVLPPGNNQKPCHIPNSSYKAKSVRVQDSKQESRFYHTSMRIN